MAPSLLRYGDTWLVTAALFLLCGVLLVALPSGRSTTAIVLALGGALALATALGPWLTRWREARKRPGVFLRPRQREAMLLAVIGLILAIPVVGFLLRPSPPPSPTAAPANVSQLLSEKAQTASRPEDRAAYLAAANIASGMEAAYQENETIRRQGGPAADEAARENPEISRYLADLERWAPKTPPSGPGETPNPSPPDLSRLPPLPNLTPRPNNSEGSLFASLVELLAGPLGPIVREILGLGLGSGYRRQVETVAQTMAGGIAPSVPEIEGVLGAADADRAQQAQDALLRLAERQLTGAELQRFRAHLEQAARPQESAAWQILAQLERDPATPPHVLLGYLGTSPPDHFASDKQRREVEKLLVPRFPQVWQEHFAGLKVQEAVPQESNP